MNEKTLHVVRGSANKWALSRALQEMGVKEEIIYLPIDFSYGHIPKDFSDKELCFALASHNKMNEFNHLKSFITTDFSSFDKIIVWHGWSASELLLLYLMSVLVKENLFQLTITDCPVFKDKYHHPPFIGMAWVAPMDIWENNMLSYAKPVSAADRKRYQEEWNRWKDSKAPYRLSSTKTGVIEEFPADFMDTSIFDLVKKESIVGNITGLLMKEFSDFDMGCSMIVERIEELCCQGKLYLEVISSDKVKSNALYSLETWVDEIKKDIQKTTIRFKTPFWKELENWPLDEGEVINYILDELSTMASSIDALKDYVDLAKKHLGC